MFNFLWIHSGAFYISQSLASSASREDAQGKPSTQGSRAACWIAASYCFIRLSPQRDAQHL